MPTISGKITTDNLGSSTHEDIYGVGGYVVVSSSWDSSQTLSSTRINQIIPIARRKVGMLVWDVDTRKHYRCNVTGTFNTTVDSGSWSAVELLDSNSNITGGTY